MCRGSQTWSPDTQTTFLQVWIIIKIGNLENNKGYKTWYLISLKPRELDDDDRYQCLWQHEKQQQQQQHQTYDRLSQRVVTLGAELELSQQSHRLARGWAPSSTRWTIYKRGRSPLKKSVCSIWQYHMWYRCVWREPCLYIIAAQVTAGGEDDIGMVEKRGGSGGHGPLLR